VLPTLGNLQRFARIHDQLLLDRPARHRRRRLGGDFEGTMLNERYMHNAPLHDIRHVVAGSLGQYARTGRSGEGLRDWCHRDGVELLAERWSLLGASA
jgi:hypothetical protein